MRRISASTSASRSSRRSTALILQRKANVSAGWSNSQDAAHLRNVLDHFFFVKVYSVPVSRRNDETRCLALRRSAATSPRRRDRWQSDSSSGVGTRTARTPPASICRASHFASALSFFWRSTR